MVEGIIFWIDKSPCRTIGEHNHGQLRRVVRTVGEVSSDVDAIHRFLGNIIISCNRDNLGVGITNSGACFVDKLNNGIWQGRRLNSLVCHPMSFCMGGTPR